MGQEYIYTYTGKKLYFADPKPDAICIEDIAHALSQTCRWAGHTKQFYSVAEHSYRVSVACPKFPLRALLHDAAEAYMGDVIRPLKAILAPLYVPLELKILGAIFVKFDLGPMSEEEEAEVKGADNVLLATEARDLTGWKPEGLPEPLFKTIQPMSALYAEQMFLERYKALVKEKTYEHERI